MTMILRIFGFGIIYLQRIEQCYIETQNEIAILTLFES